MQDLNLHDIIIIILNAYQGILKLCYDYSKLVEEIIEYGLGYN